MVERRSLFGLTLGLTLCIWIWHLAVQNTHNVEIYSTSQESQTFISLQYNVSQNISSDSPTVTFLVSSSSSSSSSSLSSLSESSSYATSLVPPIATNNTKWPNGDYKKLIDIENFEFLIKHETLCKRQPPLVLVLIHSAPKNFHKRQVIRETWGTWGKTNKRSALVFLVGTVDSQPLQIKLMHENSLNGDLVQGNFLDSYRNLTYKHVMGLKYFTYVCPDAKYVLKTDDDVFVNTPFIYDLLDNTSPLRNLLFCCEIVGDRVKRTFRSKWRVSTKEFGDKFYPNHCPGFSILYSGDVVHKLYQEAQKLGYFWIDDVWVTGTVAQKANISITPTGNYYLNNSKKKSILNGETLDAASLHFFFTEPNLKEDEIRQLWKIVVANNDSKRGIR